MLEKSQVFAQTLGVWGRIVILALDTTKAPDGVTSSHVLAIDGWQTYETYRSISRNSNFIAE
ncbi:hypothetical protein [Prevotella nigrescens]|uniref:hypothetical protein n=1 Tax=Prevotella nigrescens TaxID=28133 RepID=UPI0005661C97|nr:hypothetical protein [Prevotella nigrescens]